MARILMVDDDEGYLLAAGALLEAEGHEVVKATSAAGARDVLDTQTPDLILLDVLMPGKDGFKFSDELAGDAELSDVPVVLVTSVADSSGQMMHAFEEGKGLAAADVLPKSAAHKQLIDTVSAALNVS
ncbi:MAG: response regulator [Planctomycetota bacterium]